MGQDKRAEILLRQVKTSLEDFKPEEEKKEEAPYSKIYTFASGSDKFYQWVGYFGALLCGGFMPSFVLLMGDALNSFGETGGSKKDQLDEVSRVCVLMIFFGIGTWITAAIYFTMLSTFSYRVSKKTRVAYLQAILSQDIGWFDKNNPNELSASIGKQIYAMEAAIGEKMGDVIRNSGLILSGFAIAFARGWSYTLCMLV
jgi:ATP-binding cassette subfamily B (MDR/TAP) protein 1